MTPNVGDRKPRLTIPTPVPRPPLTIPAPVPRPPLSAQGKTTQLRNGSVSVHSSIISGSHESPLKMQGSSRLFPMGGVAEPRHAVGAISSDSKYVGPLPLPSPDTELFWTLPGPNSFLHGLSERLEEDGQLNQVIVAVPAQMPPPGLPSRIARFPCDRKVVSLELVPGARDSLFALLLQESGCDLPDGIPGPGDVISGALQHCRVVLDCSQASDLQLADAMMLIGAAGASAHSSGPKLAPLQVVLLVSGQRLPLRHDSRTRVGVTWWWGQLGRLDTALFVHHAVRIGLTSTDALTQAAIVEVAGYDLSLAQLLVDEWDSSEARLRALLEHYAAHRDGLADCVEPSRTPLEQRPGGVDLLGWSRGGCDRWGDEPRWHACGAYAGDPESTTRALWRAQASILLPLIDEHRVRAVRWLNRLGHGSALLAHAEDREYFADLIEMTDVFHYMRQHPQLKNLPQYQFIRWLYNTRNSLAHLVCLSPDSIARGMALSSRIDT